jgi:hypothetical protein
MNTLLAAVGGTTLLVLTVAGCKWRREARRIARDIESNLPPLLMRRVPLTDDDRIRLRSDPRNDMSANLKLKEGYVELMRGRSRGSSDRRVSGGESSTGNGIDVMSLGEYLSSLRPVGPTKCLEKDLELLLGAAMMRVLGSQLGPALLPVLNALPRMVGAAAGVGGVALAAAAAGTGPTAREKEEELSRGHTLAEVATSSPAGVVRAIGGLSLMSMAGAADVGAAVAKARRARMIRDESDGSHGGVDERGGGGGGENGNAKGGGGGGRHYMSDPLAIVWRGETHAHTFPSIPSPFVLSQHWNEMVDAMVRTMGEDFVPDEYSEATPTPVRENALLPDLHFGTGGIRNTHTNREILANRLLCILLNRLGTNDVLDEVREENGSRPSTKFGVKIDPGGELINRPDQLINGLMMSGHTVTAAAATRITTFGLALCVREDGAPRKGAGEDGESSAPSATSSSHPPRWIQIPLGLCLRTGLQDETGRSISTFLTHGSIDLAVRGPVIENAFLQYYHSQEGYDGWGSGHYPDAPWCLDAKARPLDDPVRAVRCCGLLSCCENSVGSRLELPIGGYGLTGVCTDSAAAVEQAVRGETGVYPLLGIGGYKVQVVRRAKELCERLGASGPDVVLADARRLCETLQRLPNDVHPIPSTQQDTARRILESCVLDDPPFALMEEEIPALQSIAQHQP